MSNPLPPYGALSFGAQVGLPPAPQLGQPGVMPGQISLPADAVAPTRFEDALPGSRVAVYAQDFDYGEECTVLQMEREWGPTSVPALHLIDSKGERRLLPSSNPQNKIQILLSAQQLGVEQIPEGAIRARTKPLDVIARQWHGGAGEASSIVLWAAAHAAIRYEDESPASDEHMVIQKLDRSSEEFLRPGDYLVKTVETGEFRVVTQGEFPELYEEVRV
jgi:hypothetical protein